MARYKYSSHWVDLHKFYEAIDSIDKDQNSRGICIVLNQINIDKEFYKGEKDHNETRHFIVNSLMDIHQYKNHLQNNTNQTHGVVDFPDFFISLSIVYLIFRENIINSNEDVKCYYQSKTNKN